MIVYVVVCDCGLNGAWCEAVCSQSDEAEAIVAEVNRIGRRRNDKGGGGGRYTGFGGAEVQTFEVDGEEQTHD